MTVPVFGTLHYNTKFKIFFKCTFEVKEQSDKAVKPIIVGANNKVSNSYNFVLGYSIFTTGESSTPEGIQEIKNLEQPSIHSGQTWSKPHRSRPFTRRKIQSSS